MSYIESKDQSTQYTPQKFYFCLCLILFHIRIPPFDGFCRGVSSRDSYFRIPALIWLSLVRKDTSNETFWDTFQSNITLATFQHKAEVYIIGQSGIMGLPMWKYRFMLKTNFRCPHQRPVGLMVIPGTGKFLFQQGCNSAEAITRIFISQLSSTSSTAAYIAYFGVHYLKRDGRLECV